MPNQKRDAERIPVPGQVTGEVSVYEPMSIMDLSERGVQVETSFPMHLGSLHELRLSLQDISVIVKGRIVHSQIGGLGEGVILYRTGVEFVEPPEHALAAIRMFVETQKVAAQAAAPSVIDAEIADEI
jgi:PilZ domain